MRKSSIRNMTSTLWNARYPSGLWLITLDYKCDRDILREIKCGIV